MKADIHSQTGNQALGVARQVAFDPLVAQALKLGRDDGRVQAFASRCMAAAKVDFIVVFDMAGIRWSHRDPEKVGQHVVGGDEAAVLAGSEYTSVAEGTLGSSVRAFTPVYDEKGKQVGAVLVGILMTQVDKLQRQIDLIIVMITLLGLTFGIGGALLLASNVKKTLFGLEPEEIAKLLEERSAMLQSVREGIVAVDRGGHISLINDVGRHMLGVPVAEKMLLGKLVSEVVPNSRLVEVMQSGKLEFDQEQNIFGTSVLTSRVPLVVNGKTVGAIATFRDKTEVKRLAEELTGVRMYVEALRSQAHEFMNRLHVILGLVRLECYDQLAAYINQIAFDHQTEVDFVSRRIKDPVIAGFILSKLSLAREKSIPMQLTENSCLPGPKQTDMSHELVTIIGNLVENAFDALAQAALREVTLHIFYEAEKLTISVSDTGPGISGELAATLFECGVSTKAVNRGIGLSLVKRSVERLSGTVTYTSNTAQGTVFTVTVPYESKVILC